MNDTPTPNSDRAKLIPVKGPASEAIEVHFNPTSLQIAITNNLREQGKGNAKTQYVEKSSAKLTLDLIFDTTVTGGDVRVETGKVAKLMAPGKANKQGEPATIVRFEWGTFTFQGLIESYKETIDFFSSNGIPLRASLNLTLASLEKAFDNIGTKKPENRAEPVIQNLSPTGDSLQQVSRQAGNSGRAIAADNGLESLRFSSGPIALNANIQLSPPTAFASAGAGISAGAGFSVGGSAGISAGAGAGFSVGGSAGVSASAGAFSELHTQRSQSRQNVRLDPTRLIQTPVTASFSNHEGSTFEMGGKVNASAESGFYADVGAKAELRSRLQFS
jgi:Contractile injection system tube protein